MHTSFELYTFIFSHRLRHELESLNEHLEIGFETILLVLCCTYVVIITLTVVFCMFMVTSRSANP